MPAIPARASKAIPLFFKKKNSARKNGVLFFEMKAKFKWRLLEYTDAFYATLEYITSVFIGAFQRLHTRGYNDRF